MKIPGFTADAAVYESRHYAAAGSLFDLAAAPQVVPQMKMSVACVGLPNGGRYCEWDNGAWSYCLGGHCSFG
jgi:hypothetical protein